MNILQLEQYIKANPDINFRELYSGLKMVGGVREVVQFPTTPPRHQLTKEFAIAKCLKKDKAISLYTKLISEKGGLSISEWDEIGKLEELPEFEPVPPDVTNRINEARSRAGSSETVFEQNFVDTVLHVLEGAQTNNNLVKGVNAYTLLEGVAGSAKSKSINFATAALERPLYTLDCMGRSPDSVAEELLGQTEIAGRASVTVKELAYIGGLTSAKARREYIDLIREYENFEAIPDEEWEKVAKFEGIVDRVPYKKPGLVQLARRYGGVLNLEELNTLTPETLTLLNAELDVYKGCHPNFYVAASMNPAGKDYSNRYALPREIRDRFRNAKELSPLGIKEIKDLVTGMLTGESPEVRIDNNVRKVTSEDFGIPSEEGERPNLLKGLTEKSRDTLIDNIVKYYIHIQGDIDKGTLDPRVSAAGEVNELRVVSLRTIGHFANTLTSALSDIKNRNKGDIWTKIEKLEKKITKTEFAQAINSSIDRSFKRPLVFMANSAELGIDTDDLEISTERHLEAIAKTNNLDIATLTSYVEMMSDSEERYKKLEDECKEKGIKLTDGHKKELKKIMELSDRDGVVLEYNGKTRLGAFGKMEDKASSLKTIYMDIEKDTEVLDMEIEDLKNLVPALNNFLADNKLSGIYIMPHKKDGKKGAALIIPKEYCVGDVANFKVVPLMEDKSVEKDQVETRDDGIMYIRPETNIDTLRNDLISMNCLRDQFRELPFYTLPFNAIEVKGRNNKKKKSIER